MPVDARGGGGAPALPRVEELALPGLHAVETAVHHDERGWFSESYQEAKLRAAGLPELRFVQANVSANRRTGTTRGLHAEPWDKYVSVVAGAALAAVLDLRAGPTFGRAVTHELVPGRALLVPRGCANGFQTLEPQTVYSYLVTAHWSPGTAYPAVDPFDPELALPWPVGAELAVVSAKDRANPPLRDVAPLDTWPGRSPRVAE